MRKSLNIMDQKGAALVTVLLAITVITILFTSVMAMQVNSMKGNVKYEEHLKKRHEIRGYLERATFIAIVENLLTIPDECERLDKDTFANRFKEDDDNYEIQQVNLCLDSNDPIQLNIKLHIEDESTPLNKIITISNPEEN